MHLFRFYAPLALLVRLQVLQLIGILDVVLGLADAELQLREPQDEVVHRRVLIGLHCLRGGSPYLVVAVGED